MSDIFEQLKVAVLEGEAEDVKKLSQQVLDEGIDPLKAINEGMVPGMNEVSNLFEKKEYFVPDLLVASRALKAGLNILLPHVSVKSEAAGKVVMGTVAGDIHEIGKNIVSALLETSGFEVVDIGVDVPTEKFVEVVKEGDYDILGISALLTFTMPEVPKIIDALKEAGVRDKIKIMVGGAPVSQEFADKVGADGYAKDGVSAVRLAQRLVQKN